MARPDDLLDIAIESVVEIMRERLGFWVFAGRNRRTSVFEAPLR